MHLGALCMQLRAPVSFYSLWEGQTRRARRGLEAACSEKLLRLLSDRAQTLHNNRTFYSKQSYRFCFVILTVFGGKMTPQC